MGRHHHYGLFATRQHRVLRHRPQYARLALSIWRRQRSVFQSVPRTYALQRRGNPQEGQRAFGW